MPITQIRHSDGRLDLFDISIFKYHLLSLASDLDKNHISIDSIVEKIALSATEVITTDELTNLASELLATMTTIHPDHSLLAARVTVSSLQNKIPILFSESISKLYDFYNEKTQKHSPLVSKKLNDIVQKNSELINKAIVPSRDFNLTYFGLKTLEKSYLLKINKVISETPQYMFMRVSLGIHGEDLESAIETYNLMSEKYFIHASPTLFNSGTPIPYLSSCFLLGISDDSIDGIYKTLHQSALISKAAGGIGIHISNIRAEGSYIAGSNGISNGIIPMLRVFNNTARYVDQGGNKRPGAFAIYLEPWHCDIFEFLNLRKNHGKEELRARDLFYALWIPDLFMEKVLEDGEWSLFSPDQARGLNNVYGDEFVKLYNSYIQQGLAMKTIKAQKLWQAILESQTETGGPFMLYKDACNRKSNQKNLGVIKSSNLCCEVVQYSSPDEVAVCNLASVALPTYVKFDEDSMWFDFTKLHDVVKVVTKNLNRVIDVTEYPLPEAKNSNLKHRPISIGVQGLADLFMTLRIPFDSNEAKNLNIHIFETVYHAALEASNELAQAHGPYESFEGSPASEGLLQFDLWKQTPTDIYDWSLLKEKIKTIGLRNSLLVGPMPTASTSQILGFNECFEPLTSNIYTRRVLSGEFQIVNKYLVEDLIELGLWNQHMKNRIVDADGSIQNIDEIPAVLKELYKTVWEIPQKKVIDLAADRGPFIDQSQSLNIYIKEPTMGKLTSMHFHGWRKGLKTGMYYLRTQAASAPIKFTIDRTVSKTGSEENLLLTPRSVSKKRTYTPLGSPIPLKRKNLNRLTHDFETFEEVQKTDELQNETEEPTNFDLTPSAFLSDKSNSPSTYDIHSSTPLSCNISEPGNCESCSG